MLVGSYATRMDIQYLPQVPGARPRDLSGLDARIITYLKFTRKSRICSERIPTNQRWRDCFARFCATNATAFGRTRTAWRDYLWTPLYYVIVHSRWRFLDSRRDSVIRTYYPGHRVFVISTRRPREQMQFRHVELHVCTARTDNGLNDDTPRFIIIGRFVKIALS